MVKNVFIAFYYFNMSGTSEKRKGGPSFDDTMRV